jgi:hypothetical protein
MTFNAIFCTPLRNALQLNKTRLIRMPFSMGKFDNLLQQTYQQTAGSHSAADFKFLMIQNVKKSSAPYGC